MIVCGARVASPPRPTAEFELVRALAHELRRAGEGPSFRTTIKEGLSPWIMVVVEVTRSAQAGSPPSKANVAVCSVPLAHGDGRASSRWLALAPTPPTDLGSDKDRPFNTHGFLPIHHPNQCRFSGGRVGETIHNPPQYEVWQCQWFEMSGAGSD